MSPGHDLSVDYNGHFFVRKTRTNTVRKLRNEKIIDFHASPIHPTVLLTYAYLPVARHAQCTLGNYLIALRESRKDFFLCENVFGLTENRPWISLVAG